MDWARTLRIDEAPADALQQEVAAALRHDGLRIAFGAPSGIDRTYVLLQGPQSIDPAELEASLPAAKWYPEAIMALAIEPAPPDALPALAQALGGPGAPAGITACEQAGECVLIELVPSVTPASFVLAVADAELRRFSGYRRVRLLSPLTVDALAKIAADGLQAAEIRPDRILEALLERANVE